METNKFQQNYSLKISFYFTWLKHHNMKFPFYKFQNYPCNLNQENKSKLSNQEEGKEPRNSKAYFLTGGSGLVRVWEHVKYLL